VAHLVDHIMLWSRRSDGWRHNYRHSLSVTQGFCLKFELI
jgi:hypothetical protein